MMLGQVCVTAATAAVGCAAAQRVCRVLHQGAKQHLPHLSSSVQQQAGPGVAPRLLRQFDRCQSHLHASSRYVVAAAAEANTVEVEVKVEGMKCGGCSSRVEAALKAMDHVKGVQVDLETKLATVEVEAPNLIDAMNMLPMFVKAITDLGFEAEPHIEYQA